MSNSTWKRIGAAGGIGFVVLQLTSQSLIQIGGAEPAFNAPAQEILEFFMNRNSGLFALGGYLSILSIIAFLWFLGSLWSTLRSAEGDPAWLSTVALGSGLLVAAVIPSSGMGWPLAVFRIDEGLDPQLARLHFDVGNFAFANLWVTLASFLLATGLVTIRSRALPLWIGWLGVVVAILLLVARAFWAFPSVIVFLPYTVFWIWLISTSIVLIRRG